MYGLIGKIVAVPGQRDALTEILTGMERMEGCLSYVVATVVDEPNALWVTEVWESADAHTASLSDPDVQQAMEAGRPKIAGFGNRVETTPIGGIGIG